MNVNEIHDAPIAAFWVDGQEIMQILKIGKDALKLYRSRGVLTYSKLKNGKIMYDKQKLLNDLEQNKRGGVLMSNK